MENKLSSNNEIQLTKTCENCIQDRELVEEIIKLCEYATELEAVTYDLENQIVELEAVIYDLENQIVAREQELYFLF